LTVDPLARALAVAEETIVMQLDRWREIAPQPFGGGLAPSRGLEADGMPVF